MYIKKVVIDNIRSISHFEMNFGDQCSGWHVLIGVNGAGKSSIIRSIALALVGPEEIQGIQPNWNNQLKWKQKKGYVKLEMQRADRTDVQGGNSGVGFNFKVQLNLIRQADKIVTLDMKGGALSQAKATLWGRKSGWFSAGYGPFRRFTGGSNEMEKVFENPRLPRLAAHLSLFGEDVALTEVTKWLMKLDYQILEKRIGSETLHCLKELINSNDFLPNNTKLHSISSDGVWFIDGNGSQITIDQMSDGYRSILSLTFELIRQMIRVFGDKRVFRNVQKGIMIIDVPGVVLIDEIDAHLHPTWQTRVGQWFTKYFPNTQFIVTTHSPLVCRAAEHGTIWQLTAPGEKDNAKKNIQVLGLNKDRLVFGNVLDAYATEIFGKSLTISAESNEKRKLLGELQMKSVLGETLKPKEKKDLEELKAIFSTEKSLQK